MTREEEIAMLDRLEALAAAPESIGRDELWWPNSRIDLAEALLNRTDELLALARRAIRAEKALEEIASMGVEDGEDLETASSGRNFDDTYYEGDKHGSFVAGEIARKALTPPPETPAT